MQGAQQVRVQNSYRRSFDKTLLSLSGLPGLGIGREIMANARAKAAECAGRAPFLQWTILSGWKEHRLERSSESNYARFKYNLEPGRV